MTFYARPSWRLVRQVLADACVLAWAVAWWLAGRAADASLRSLAGPAHDAARTASDLRRQAGDLAAQAANVPVVGDGLRGPVQDMAASLGGLATSAQSQAAGIEHTATILGWLVFLIPVLSVVAVWLPGRLRFALRARTVSSLAGHAQGADLLALRALAHGSLQELTAVSADPVAAWRAGDRIVIDRLAELELASAGVRRQGSSRARHTSVA